VGRAGNRYIAAYDDDPPQRIAPPPYSRGAGGDSLISTVPPDRAPRHFCSENLRGLSCPVVSFGRR
jgi:hypothetical protein